jgi:hypothetical protein
MACRLVFNSVIVKKVIHLVCLDEYVHNATIQYQQVKNKLFVLNVFNFLYATLLSYCFVFSRLFKYSFRFNFLFTLFTLTLNSSLMTISIKKVLLVTVSTLVTTAVFAGASCNRPVPVKPAPVVPVKPAPVVPVKPAPVVPAKPAPVVPVKPAPVVPAKPAPVVPAKPAPVVPAKPAPEPTTPVKPKLMSED